MSSQNAGISSGPRVLSNAHVQAGLSLSNVVLAFTTSYALTWLSLMLATPANLTAPAN
jgi:hypothetical protein